MQTSSFDSLNGDLRLTLDTSPSSFGTSSHPSRVSPVYNQPRLNALEHASESPNPNPAVTNHTTSLSYLPAGPMQFSAPLPLPSRQSELQAEYFNTAHVRTQQDPLPTPKRPKPSDFYDDGQGEQPDAQEQEAPKPKP